MMLMRPPQHGHGCELVDGSLGPPSSFGMVLRFWHGEQFARSRDVVGAGRFGEQAVVTNAMEALGQDVDEEATYELACCERHALVPHSAVGAIVFVFERDAVLVERNQSAIGDGNTVGVARQISKDRLRSAERALCIAASTCLTNGSERASARVPRLRERPTRTRKSSLESPAIPRQLDDDFSAASGLETASCPSARMLALAWK